MAEQYSVEQVFKKKIQVQNNAFDPSDNIIMLTFDDNYIDQSMNLILSIARYNPENVSFICTCPILSQHNIDLLLSLEQGIKVQCYEFSLDFEMGRWPASTLLRLFASWLLDREIHRVLYMDSDILCTGSLQALFDMELPCIAMCTEISGNVSMIQQKVIRPICPTQSYCNAGVTLFNLDYLRANHTFHEIYCAYCSLHSKIAFLDQDFLNIYYQGKITVLNGFHYDFQPHELEGTRYYKNALRNCRLIHFSVGKPWIYKSHPRYIRLYIQHSLYPPMIRRIQKVYIKSLLWSPVRRGRRMLSPFKQAWLAHKNKEKN